MSVSELFLCEDELNIVLNVVYEEGGSEFEVESPGGSLLLHFSYDDPRPASPCSKEAYLDRDVPYSKYVDALATGGCLPPPNIEEVAKMLARVAEENVFTQPKPTYIALDTNLFYLRFPTHHLTPPPFGLRIAVPEPVRSEISRRARMDGGQLDVRLAKQALAEYEYVEKRLGAHFIRGEGVGDVAVARAIKGFLQTADVILLTADDNMRVTAMNENVPTLFVEQQTEPGNLKLTYRNIPTTISSLATTYSRVKLRTMNPLIVTWVYGWWKGKKNEEWLSRTLKVQAPERIAGKVARELKATRGA